MNTFDIGPLFVAPARFVTNMARVPLLGSLPAQETEPPFRHATALYFRVPLTEFGGIFGIWRKTKQDPETALMAAIGGDGFDLYDETEEDNKRTVRERVAEYANGDLDTEWEIVNYLGLHE